LLNKINIVFLTFPKFPHPYIVKSLSIISCRDFEHSLLNGRLTLCPADKEKERDNDKEERELKLERERERERRDKRENKVEIKHYSYLKYTYS
jgi:hypothetical protein